MSVEVRLGNPNPQMQVRQPIVENGEVTGYTQISQPAEHLSQSITTAQLADYATDTEFVDHTLSTSNFRPLVMVQRILGPEHRAYAVAVVELDQIVEIHMGGDSPDWVSVPEDEGLQAAVAHFYGCAEGEPTMLLTNAGRDALHTQHINSGAQPAAFQYMAVSANATAESAASTTLPGEITTAGGGLLRGTATPAHTTGTNTSTLTKTFTANGSDSLPVVIAKIGVFNATSAGTLGYEKLLASTSTLTASGDNVTVTWTDTVG